MNGCKRNYSIACHLKPGSLSSSINSMPFGSEYTKSWFLYDTPQSLSNSGCGTSPAVNSATVRGIVRKNCSRCATAWVEARVLVRETSCPQCGHHSTLGEARLLLPPCSTPVTRDYSNQKSLVRVTSCVAMALCNERSHQ